jgi:hypothetical protein
MMEAHVCAFNPPKARLVSIHVDVWMNATWKERPGTGRSKDGLWGA